MDNWLKEHVIISDEVKKGLLKNNPVVALESTIITHGMPYPENVETALAVEEIIRDEGAIPATIAILNGKIKIGLTNDEIRELAQLNNVIKVSRRDIPYVLVKKLNGATTVAGTMFLSYMAGIKVFATGGIGGVHRKGNETFDISADLMELAQTDVLVVSAGAKAILDLGLTIEYLETQGVPVLGYKTTKFPAFYTVDSGFNVNYQVDNVEEIAEIMDAKWRINLKGGIIVANPIPEEFALEKNYVEKIITEALKEMEERKIAGKEVTPFLLERIAELTGKKSLEANIALVKNNAKLGAKIAKEYMQIITNV